MKPTIDVYLGSPIDHSSERLFLERLCGDLYHANQPAVILSNLILRRSQIDFVIITEEIVCHVELKNYTAPVHGLVNGRWRLLTSDGYVDTGRNAFQQALGQKYDLSDEMRRAATAKPQLRTISRESKFLYHFLSTVCIYPEIHVDSQLPKDNKIKIVSYFELLYLLKNETKNPGWTLNNWREFAMFLGLSKSDNYGVQAENASVSKIDPLVNYVTSVEGLLQATTHELVSTRLRGRNGLVTVKELTLALENRRSIMLYGISGSGKTHLAKHLALIGSSRRIPIILKAKEFDGDLFELLGRGIAHSTQCSAREFLNLTVAFEREVVLVVDGVNECHPDQVEMLLTQLHELTMNFGVCSIVTTQTPVQIPGIEDDCAFELIELSHDEKLQILESYGADRATLTNEADVLNGFSTPYEISLLAHAYSKLNNSRTRPALLEAYARLRLSSNSSPTIAFRALAEIALDMNANLRSSISSQSFHQIANSVVGSHGGSLAVVDALLQSGLIEINQGRYSFCHELIELFFQSAAFLQHLPEKAFLHDELSKPQNRRFVELVIASLEEPDQIRDLLVGFADETLFSAALAGRLGPCARDSIREYALESLALSIKTSTLVELSLESDLLPKSKRPTTQTAGPHVSTIPIDGALLGAIGRNLDYLPLCEAVLELSSVTDDQLVRSARQLAKQTGDEVSSVLESMFRVLYVVNSSNPLLPISAIVHAFNRQFDNESVDFVGDLLAKRGIPIEDYSQGWLFLLCHCVRARRGTNMAEMIPELLRTCWHSKNFHLRFACLQAVRQLADPVFEGTTARFEVESLLLEIETNNLSLSMMLIDTLSRFDLVDCGTDAEAVTIQLRTLLETPNSTDAQETAYFEISNLFEPAFENVYTEAIFGLDKKERHALLVMAGLGTPTHASNLDYIVRELVDSSYRESIHVFRKWGSEICAEPFFLNEAVSVFVLSNIGSAKFLDKPFGMNPDSSNDDFAWRAYGDIFFWLCKPDMLQADVVERCSASWSTLLNELYFEAVDPLFQLGSVGRKGPYNDGSSFLHDLCDCFPFEVKSILEKALLHPAGLSTVFTKAKAFMLPRHLEFAISTLGIVGDLKSIHLLDELEVTGTAEALILNAIREIKKRVQD